MSKNNDMETRDVDMSDEEYNTSFVQKIKNVFGDNDSESNIDTKSATKTAAKTVGRKVSNNQNKAKDKELKPKSFSVIKAGLDAARKLPFGAKVVAVAYLYDGHKLKSGEKKMAKQQKQLRDMQESARAASGDIFANAYNRVMLKYEQERLEKLAKKLEKRNKRVQKNSKLVNNLMQGVTHAVNTMAQKNTVEAMVGDTKGVDRNDVVSTTNQWTTNTSQYASEYGG